MAKRIDLTGQKFNMLTVIKLDHVGKRSTSYWLCKCDCGNEAVVNGGNLRSGATKSCGCLKHIASKKKMKENAEKENRQSLVGKRFGRLTVISNKCEDVISKTWVCKCDCGKVLELPESQLPLYKSCGCQNREDAKNNIGEYVGRIDGTSVSKIRSKKTPSTNTSGTRGVSFNKRTNKWQAYIGFKGKHYNLGYYKNINDAIKARKLAEDNLYGKFLDWYENEYKKSTPSHYD